MQSEKKNKEKGRIEVKVEGDVITGSFLGNKEAGIHVSSSHTLTIPHMLLHNDS